jgi:protein PhnA
MESIWLFYLFAAQMNDLSPCPKCQSEFTYPSDYLMICPDCGHEWNPEEVQEVEEGFVVKDSNGTVLNDGDSVVVIKNLPVKGFPSPIKSGTKVKNIRLVDKDHNIDCKIDGFGSMGLKSEFVKKA